MTIDETKDKLLVARRNLEEVADAWREDGEDIDSDFCLGDQAACALDDIDNMLADANKLQNLDEARIA